MKRQFSIGLDFGTESGRAILVDVACGALVASSVYEYRFGVIDERLPGSKRIPLEPQWALQDPLDYLRTVQKTIPELLRKGKVKAEDVIGIGIDFTSCTVLPALSDGVPLCTLPQYRNSPHAWVKLWKHHGAQRDADKMNALALERREPFILRYGQKISSEWMFPKLLQILREDPQVARTMAIFIEAQDWVVWQLTGREKRSACAAGYKALWSRRDGFPPSAFLDTLRSGLSKIISEKIGNSFAAPGTRAGGLTPAWAHKTGLRTGTSVSVAIIDAHSAVLGLGVSDPNELVLCMGTSTCHLLLSRREQLVEGICGVVEDGILPGYYGYEAGQAAVGDLFAWQVKSGWGAPSSKKKNLERFSALERSASAVHPGESGLVALDWWNGNRSILSDARLSGAIIGYTLNTKPHEVYRTLMESTALGTLKIIEEFERQKIPIRKLHATGGLAERSPLLLQIYADVTGRNIDVTLFPHLCALGAAILGAVGAGAKYSSSSFLEIVLKMTQNLPRKYYKPDPQNHRIYRVLYGHYSRLHDYFGRGQNKVMQELKMLKGRWRKTR